MRAAGVFGREHVALLSADEASALDRRAQDRYLPERALMESAGRAAAQVIQRLHPTGRVVAVVGKGNNGGDALVALRSLAAWGRAVAWIAAAGDDHDPDARLATGFDLPRVPAAEAVTALSEAGVIVDGILGTGASGEPREPAAGMIRAMNHADRPIVALDIPTGVDPTTGEVPGVAVMATTTVMFGWPKRGGLFQPGRARCGRIVAVEIGFPPLPDDGASAALITPDWARSRLPARSQDAHKNAVGRVAVVAGRKGMAGAAAIAAHSAVRAGAGLVRIVSDDANRSVIQALVPEALFIDRHDPAGVEEAVGESDAVLVGPGIGTGDEGRALLDAVLRHRGDAGLVVDADALTLLAGTDTLAGLGPDAVLTPHPGEMSRLTDASTGDIRRDPIAHARGLAGRTGAVVLLKGMPSVVAEEGRPVMVNSVGSSDLAAAAMGDQLGGVVTAFRAAGAAPRRAAALGLFYAGRASELARRNRGLTPDDVAEHLHRAFEQPGPETPPLDLPFVLFDQPPRW